MTPTLESLGIDRLSIQERVALVQAIWDSIATEAEATLLTEVVRQEIERATGRSSSKSRAAAIPGEQIEAEALAQDLKS